MNKLLWRRMVIGIVSVVIGSAISISFAKYCEAEKCGFETIYLEEERLGIEMNKIDETANFTPYEEDYGYNDMVCAFRKPKDVALLPTHAYYSISGKMLPKCVQDYFYDRLKEYGIERYYKYFLAQAFQESGWTCDGWFCYTVSKDGKDHGLLQYRKQFWGGADIYDVRNQIDTFVPAMAKRLNSGLTIEESISRHMTSDYCTQYMESYVSACLSWMGRMVEVK